MNKNIEKLLKGHNPLKYVTKIETNPYDRMGFVKIDNYKKNIKSIQRYDFTKFVMFRNPDLMKEFFNNLVAELKPLYLEAKKKFEVDKPALEQKSKDITAQNREYKSRLSKLNVDDQQYKHFSDLKRKNEAFRDEYKEQKDKIDKDFEYYSDRYNKAVKNKSNCINLPSLNEIKLYLEEYNKSKRLYGDNAIKLSDLKIDRDHDRLKYGYTLILKTENLYADITDFLKYANISLYSEEIRSMDFFLSIKLQEQFYISTGIRNFKGFDNYEDVHKMTFDIETVSLYPVVADCKACNKRYNLSNTLEVPKFCKNEITEGKKQRRCNSETFNIDYIGDVFNISIKDNRGYKKVLKASGYIDSDGVKRINQEEARKVVMDFFKVYLELNPSIINGYNSEVFDWGYILTMVEKYKVNLKPVQCFVCGNGLYDKKENEFLCNNTDCNHSINNDVLDEYISNLNYFLESVIVKCSKCYKGSIVKGKTMFGCSNYKDCYNRYEFEDYEKTMLDKLLGLKNFVPSSDFSSHYIRKRLHPSSLKLGADTEKYHQTELFLCNSIDTNHATRRAKAINSSIPNVKLKTIADIAPLKAKEDRTYVDGNKIFEYDSDSLFFITNKVMEYKAVPSNYTPEEYLKLVNEKDILKDISDYEEYFMSVNKEIDDNSVNILELDEFNHDGENSTKEDDEVVEDKTKQFYKRRCSEYYESNCGNFSLITGAKIIENYAMDDVIETEKVDDHYNKERFLTNMYFPTTFEKFATMGVASAWNLLATAHCFLNNIAVPHRIEGKLPVGGLSRMWHRGFAENIQKMDFASLYPSLMLALDIYPDFAPYIIEFLQYFYDMRMYYNKRKKCKTSEELIKFLEEDGHEKLATVKKWVEEGKTEEIEAFMKKYTENADNIQLPCKININGIFGFLGSTVGLCADMTKACQITSSGRMFFRSLLVFMTHFNSKGLVGDTDGINFSMPKYIDKDIITLQQLGKPILLEDVEYNGKKGENALIARYNSLMFPTTGYMELSNDGVWVNCINAAKKNYINLEPDGKVKLTGNSFKSSTSVDLIKSFNYKTVSELMKTKDLSKFLKDYQTYARMIAEGSVSKKFLVKKARVRSTMEEYENRGYTKKVKKDGEFQIKAKQAHMELLKVNNIKPELGQMVYYINNAETVSAGDADLISMYEDMPKTYHSCVECNKKSVNKPEVCENKVKVRCVSNSFSQIATTLWKCDECGNTKEQKTEPKSCKIVIEEVTCNSTEYIILNEFECLNPNCKKKHTINSDLMLEFDDNNIVLNDGIYKCNNKSIECESEEFQYIMKREKVGERAASYLVSEDDLLESGDEICEYNKKLYLEKVFNNKFKPLLCVFHPSVRDKVLLNVNSDFDNLLELTGEFTKMYAEDFDSMEESLTLEKKEIDFWNESGLNPLELIPLFEDKIRINGIIDKYVEFNKFFDELKAKRPNMVFKRSKRMAKTDEYYLTGNDYTTEYVLMQRTDGSDRNSEDKIIATYDKTNEKWNTK